MTILFKKKRLQKIFSDRKELQEEFGLQLSGKIAQRMHELLAAASLAEISSLPPPRCHEHSGDELGIFTVDISRNYRLSFQPAGIKIPRNKNTSLDLSKIDTIIILGVVDPH